MAPNDEESDEERNSETIDEMKKTGSQTLNKIVQSLRLLASPSPQLSVVSEDSVSPDIDSPAVSGVGEVILGRPTG